MMKCDGTRYWLAIPIYAAMPFALGAADFHGIKADDDMRRLIGTLIIDHLEANEDWRDAALVKTCLRKKWPGYFA